MSPQEISYLLSFEKNAENSNTLPILKKSAVPLALIAGFLIAVFPSNTQEITVNLPSWTNLGPQALAGADYIWNIIGEPVGKTNILYHIPNIILYAFGFLGVKKLFEAIDRRTWIDRVKMAKDTLTSHVQNGTVDLNLVRGHSVLFLGNGDFIGMQFVLNHKNDQAVVVSQTKPQYTDIWNYFDANSSFEDLQNLIDRTCQKDTGEYIFFPVKDDQIFLPSESSYDLSPHKLDILCQDLRTIEKKNNWKPKRILIVGDQFHKSYVHSEDRRGKIKNTEDTISLATIAKKYPNITIIDPTEIVLSEIIKIAGGRTIAFRATKEGINEYKKRFYDRLEKLKYRQKATRKGILTIGYDLLEDQTEQQTLSRKIDDYYPVVLSKSVRDALIRNGYKKNEFIYVPELVLEYLKKEAEKR